MKDVCTLCHAIYLPLELKDCDITVEMFALHLITKRFNCSIDLKKWFSLDADLIGCLIHDKCSSVKQEDAAGDRHAVTT